MLDYLDLAYVYADAGTPPVRETIDALRSSGCTGFGGGDQCRYTCVATDWEEAVSHVDDAVEAVASEGRGSIQLWWDDMDISWWFGWGMRERDDGVTAISFSIDKVYFRETGTDELTLGELEDAVTNVSAVAWSATMPDYGLVAPDTWFGAVLDSPLWNSQDRDRPLDERAFEAITDGARHVGWLTCLPPGIVDDVGWEALDALPVDETRALDDDSALIRLSEHPEKYEGERRLAVERAINRHGGGGR